MKSVDLIRKIPSFFFNEYQLKKLALGRRSYLYSSILKRNSTNLIYEILYRSAYSILSLFGFIQLLFKHRIDSEKNFFIYHDERNLQLAPNGYLKVRIGLKNLRYNHHLYQTISRLTMIKVALNSLLGLFSLLSVTKNYVKGQEISLVRYWALNGFGFTKLCDALLFFEVLLENGNRNIAFAEHYSFYVSTLSYLRENHKIRKLVGFQHGTFRVNPDLNLEGIYVDEFTLLFRQSKSFFIEQVCSNPDVIIHFGEKHLLLTSNEKKGKIIAVAIQPDDLAADLEIICCVMSLMESKDDVVLFVYIHPLLSSSELSDLTELVESQTNISVFKKERHKNIDLLITRHSTLGVQYYNLGIEVVFLPLKNMFCALSEIESNRIVNDFEELRVLLANRF